LPLGKLEVVMAKRRMRVGSVVLALLAVSSLAGAQELRGRITGTVQDNTGAVVPGVTVTASSPALIQPQTTTTGEDGTYRFPALPSGVYTVAYEISGFRPLKREGIRVTLNTTLTIDAQLQLATMTEEVTVLEDTPVVDIKSTNIGTTFTKELLTEIPNARDLWAAMSQAPGFQMGGYDVGGSHTGTQTAYTTYGVPTDNKTYFDGINVTESRNANAGYFDYGSFEEFQLGGAGNLGEASGPGALLNFTVKSGGDQFRGEAYFDFQNDDTIFDNIPDEFTRSGGTDSEGFRAPVGGLGTANTTTKQYDLNVGVGGPIVKGRLWFYAGYRDNNQYRVIAGLPGEEAQSQLVNYTGKLTYAINSRNNLIAMYNSRTKLQPLRELSLASPPESAWYQASKNIPTKLEWTSVMSDRAFLNLQVAHWKNDFPLFPTQTQSASNEGIGPGRLDLTTGQRTGARSYYHQRITNKPQVSGALSYFKEGWGGDHAFKLGVEWFRERREFLRFGPEGEVFYRDRGGAPAEVDIWNTPNAGVDDNKNLAFYLNDGWSLNRRFTLNLAVRYDRYTVGWPEQSGTPVQTQHFQPAQTQATTLFTWNSVAPRAGFAWDVTGKGKTVLKAFAGRFYINPSTDIGSNENPVGAAARRFRFNDLNGNRVLDPGELGAQLTTVGGAGFVRVDRDIEHPYGDELSASIEHELFPSLSVRSSYVNKRVRNLDDEVDVARVNAYTIPFTFLDVGADNQRGTADDQTLNLFDRPAAIASDRLWTNPCRVPGVPCEDGDYHSVEFALNRRYKDKWMLLTSFEHTWANDFRSNTQASTSAIEAVRHAQRFLWRPNARTFGAQEQTWWNFKVVGRYDLGWGVGVGASYKLQSGFNWARLISVGLPNAGSESVYAEPIDTNRAPNVGILDVRLDKSFSLSRAGKLTFIADLFNATNSNVVTNFRVTSGTRFQEVISVLDPRVFRFGVRYTY
jgi:hypothetical protein